MIRITDNTKCTGCTACMNKCPVGCISMKEDHEGFLYPVADESVCIDCGACETVCPFNNQATGIRISSYAVRTALEQMCSSGGAVSAFLDVWVRDGGSVYGASFDEDLAVVHIMASSSEDVLRLRNSKYVQSRLDDVFSMVKADLDSGEKVLFVGTPCQVAGLKSFVGIVPDSLVTVQLACHGVPPCKLWRAYLDSKGLKVKNVNFRDKSSGWKNYYVRYISDSKVRLTRFDKDTYVLAYLQNLSMRPSCYDCRFRGETYADISAGDLWNISQALPEYDDGKGYTLVNIHSDKGQRLLDKIQCEICIPVEYGKASAMNSGFGGSIAMPASRDSFFKDIYSQQDVITYMERFIKRTSAASGCYRRIHSLLSRIKKRILR